MSLDQDPNIIFKTLLQIKDDVSHTRESVIRTETKVDSMSDFKTRIESLESSRNQVYGIMGTISLAWIVLLAWVNGMGEWVHHLFIPTNHS